MTADQSYLQFCQWLKDAEGRIGPIRHVVAKPATWYQISRSSYRRLPYREFRRIVRGGK